MSEIQIQKGALGALVSALSLFKLDVDGSPSLRKTRSKAAPRKPTRAFSDFVEI